MSILKELAYQSILKLDLNDLYDIIKEKLNCMLYEIKNLLSAENKELNHTKRIRKIYKFVKKFKWPDTLD